MKVNIEHEHVDCKMHASLRRREKEGLKAVQGSTFNTYTRAISHASHVCRIMLRAGGNRDQFQGYKTFLRVNERVKGSGDDVVEGAKDEPT